MSKDRDEWAELVARAEGGDKIAQLIVKRMEEARQKFLETYWRHLFGGAPTETGLEGDLVVSKEETCAGFHPDAIDEAMRSAAETGPCRELPRPVVPDGVADTVAELDDLIRWAAELAQPGRLSNLRSTNQIHGEKAERQVEAALVCLGAARAMLIAAGLA